MPTPTPHLTTVPKSALILQNGLDYIINNNENAGLYSFGTLTLLASGNPLYADRIRDQVYSIIPSAANLAKLNSDDLDSASNTTWPRGHNLIVLAEYYLATNDATVLPAIEALAHNIAKGQSFFGTVGHKYADRSADGSNGPMGGVYGVVNSAGLPCFLGLVLAEKCGITDPELQPAIDRTARFFSYYANKGAIPYGEHEPFNVRHESNGKSGLAAVTFSLLPDRSDEAHFFSQMATAAAGEREIGHTGSFFNYLWAPLGAATGGEEAAASHFSRMSWLLDLARNWDGSFDYDCLNGEGPNSGEAWHSFRMSTPALLLYALPQRNLHITGKTFDPATQGLTTLEVADAASADVYDPSTRTVQQLILDLGFWSPKIQNAAATSLANDQVLTPVEVAQIEALATNPNSNSRPGACQALGFIGAASSAPVLASLLTEEDLLVRYWATEGMRYLPQASRLAELDTILAAAASTAKPWFPFVEEDPLQFAHAKISALLFYNKGFGGPHGILTQAGIDGVDRELLYPAIRACAATPVGLFRAGIARVYNQLTYQETIDLADTIVESVMVRAPADKMFTQDIRVAGLELLERYEIAEGVPLAKIVIDDDGRGSVRNNVLDILADYAGSVTDVNPDPDIIGYLNQLLMEGRVEAQDVLDAIAADTNPTPLAPLKSIETLSASPQNLILPSNSTTLLVAGSDSAKGDSFFTFQTLNSSDPSFTPLTDDGSETLFTVTTQPSAYEVEVTMADARGLTEVTDTIIIDVDVPLLDLTPPSPNPMTFASQPTALNETTVTMSAQPAFDYSEPIEYLFWNETNNTNSGWSTALTWTESNLTAGASYQYRVKARDNSSFQNETEWSLPSSATAAPDGTAPLAPVQPWTNVPTAISATAITMSAAAGSDPNGVEYYFTNISFPDGSHDSGWQTSPDFTDNNLQAGITYHYTVTIRDQASPPNQSASSSSFSTTTNGSGRIFADLFARTNSTDLNGNQAGKSGALAPLNWQSRRFANTTIDINSSSLRMNGPAGDSSFGGLAYLDHNFSDAALSGGGFFNVGFAITGYSTVGSSRQMTVGIGQSLSDLQTQTGVSPSNHLSDLAVSYRRTTSSLEIYKNGVLDSTETVNGGLPNPTTFMRISCTFPDCNAGSEVAYSIFFGNSSTPFTSGTFTWSGTRENYLSLASNLSNDARFDNLQIDGAFGNPLIFPDLDWAFLPTSLSASEVTMTAQTIGNSDQTEYYFTNLSFPDGSHDSGWQSSPTYLDTGLSIDTTYNYSVIARDRLYPSNQSNLVPATSVTTSADSTPPNPDPANWQVAPTAVASTTIAMSAIPASDHSGVEYYFTNLSFPDGSHDSGWQSSPSFSDHGLAQGPSYTYTVTARDLSTALNQTAPSAARSASTVSIDDTPPNPNAMTWATPPTTLSTSTIVMTASPATDLNGVEYYFTETSGNPGGSDSGWQDSPTFFATGLASNNSYTYTVKARDKSPYQNETTPSSALTASIVAGSTVLFGDTFDRPNSTDLNSSSDGQSGTLAPLTYGTRTFDNVIIDIENNALRVDGPATSGSFGGLIFLDNHNFIDPELSFGGKFSISYDIADYNTSGSSRQMSLGIGQSLAELNSQTGVAPSDHLSDLLIAYRRTTRSLEIYKNGVLDSAETVSGGLPLPETTLRVDVSLTDFNAGSLVSYQVFFDDSTAPFTSGTFNWSGTNENYLSLASNLTGNARFNNLLVTAQASLPGNDYALWSTNHSSANLSDPTADSDHDGMTNQEERLLGLDPNSATSVSPYLVPLDSSGTFTYSRRSPALTGYEYAILTSTNLVDWAVDQGASQTVDSVSEDGTEIVTTTLSETAADYTFYRIEAKLPESNNN